jgi:hypothetical protein
MKVKTVFIDNELPYQLVNHKNLILGVRVSTKQVIDCRGDSIGC